MTVEPSKEDPQKSNLTTSNTELSETTPDHESVYEPDENTLRPDILEEPELKANNGEKEEDKHKTTNPPSNPDDEKNITTPTMNKIIE